MQQEEAMKTYSKLLDGEDDERLILPITEAEMQDFKLKNDRLSILHNIELIDNEIDALNRRRGEWATLLILLDEPKTSMTKKSSDSFPVSKPKPKYGGLMNGMREFMLQRGTNGATFQEFKCEVESLSTNSNAPYRTKDTMLANGEMQDVMGRFYVTEKLRVLKYSNGFRWIDGKKI